MLDKVLKNQQKEIDKAHKERDSRCEPIAAEMLQILAKHKIDPSITNRPEDHSRMLAAYTPVYQEMMELAMKNDLSIIDIHYSIQILLSYFEFTKTLIDNSLKHNLTVAEEKVWGKPVNDLTVKELDAILKSQENKAV